MRIIRHPKLADDIRNAAMHYAEISERVLSGFWSELDSVNWPQLKGIPEATTLIHVASVEPISENFRITCSTKSMMRQFFWWFSGTTEGTRIMELTVEHKQQAESGGGDGIAPSPPPTPPGARLCNWDSIQKHRQPR